MNVSLLELLDTTRLSTIKSLHPILNYFSKMNVDEVNTLYCYPNPGDLRLAKSSLDASLAFALLADKYKDMLVQDLQDLFCEGILKLTQVIDKDRMYFDFCSGEGLSVSILDLYCHELDYPGLVLNYEDVAFTK